MKKNIEEISDGIFLVKGYISKDTAKFLIDAIAPYLVETPRYNIYGGPMGEHLVNPDSVSHYKDSSEYNMAIDIYNGLIFSINNIVSEKFKEQHKVKSYFFSCMLPGSLNDIHMDNHHEDENGIIHVREKYISNKSGLLYLNDEYQGGELVFPKQGISIKPEAGSLIFFEGDYIKPHGVNQIVSGSRYNLVTFYEPVN
jgi:hypothetical protein